MTDHNEVGQMFDTMGHPILEPVTKDEYIRLECLGLATNLARSQPSYRLNVEGATKSYEHYVRTGEWKKFADPHCDCGVYSLPNIVSLQTYGGDMHGTAECFTAQGNRLIRPEIPGIK